MAEDRDQCRVHRFREGEDDLVGQLARRPGDSWYFDYDAVDSTDDESGYRLGGEHFVIGEYVSIADEHGHDAHLPRRVGGAPLDPSVARPQLARSSGRGMFFSISRVTPPRMRSRKRECP